MSDGKPLPDYMELAAQVRRLEDRMQLVEGVAASTAARPDLSRRIEALNERVATLMSGRVSDNVSLNETICRVERLKAWKDEHSNRLSAVENEVVLVKSGQGQRLDEHANRLAALDAERRRGPETALERAARDTAQQAGLSVEYTPPTLPVARPEKGPTMVEPLGGGRWNDDWRIEEWCSKGEDHVWFKQLDRSLHYARTTHPDSKWELVFSSDLAAAPDPSGAPWAVDEFIGRMREQLGIVIVPEPPSLDFSKTEYFKPDRPLDEVVETRGGIEDKQVQIPELPERGFGWALEQLRQWRKVRLPHWPPDRFLQRDKRFVAVFMHYGERQSDTAWRPQSSEMFSDQWELVQ